jgi:hypothetical protein
MTGRWSIGGIMIGRGEKPVPGLNPTFLKEKSGLWYNLHRTCSCSSA